MFRVSGLALALGATFVNAQDCPPVEQGLNCDQLQSVWDCAYLESLNYDCSGCSCTTSASACLTSTCLTTYTCDSLIELFGYTCSILESQLGCECGGCACDDGGTGGTGGGPFTTPAAGGGPNLMGCAVDNVDWVMDAYCDGGDYNVESCDWDGGDCCEASCLAEDADYDCGSNGYMCLDPDLQVELPAGCVVDVASFIGDGYCDSSDEYVGYNTLVCGWDGGDCCESSCVEAIYECGSHGYNCIDPTSPNYGCDAVDSPYLGDGICDVWTIDLSYHLNTAICNWDNGDCCPSTCSTGTTTPCNNPAYTCSDPDATDYGAEGDCIVSNPSWIMDAYCDAGTDGYNTELCDWDGGDCCASTCLAEPRFYDCGEVAYACLDPDAAETQGVVPPNCDITFVSWLADGYCDEGSDNYNTLNCDWDSGDCCESTCVSSEIHSCGSAEYFCKDPDATDYDDSQCVVDDLTYLNDGFCDTDGGYNTHVCDWDGGDCCEATCTPSLFSCTNGYRCLDPSDSGYGVCQGMSTGYYADGFCDTYNYDLALHLNAEVCDWDGGDCCPSTCMTADGSPCTGVVYECLDPDATDFGATSQCVVNSPSWIGDAYCDSGSSDYNTAVCGWDGGDCCQDTCLNEDINYQCGTNGYECMDPDSSYYVDPGDCAVAVLSYVADSYCDGGDYNTEACDWDGGDCCEDTCETFPESPYNCGVNSAYECLDPDSSTTGATCIVEVPSYIGDGYCDSTDEYTGYNTQSCAWDGGDCCESVCTANTFATPYDCGSHGYNCIDPSASDYGCDGLTSPYYGDGICDIWTTDLSYHFNTEICSWDGGDCCPSTCTSTEACSNLAYTCSDPDATDYGAVGPCVVDNPSWIMDAYCDAGYEGYNVEVCGWDGGDCCASTCLLEPRFYECGVAAYACADPDASESQVAVPDGCDISYISWLADGFCDPDDNYNTLSCGWDGGDCCQSTCVSSDTHACGTAAYECWNPAATDYCSVEVPSYIGDGYCDSTDEYTGYNTMNCAWDGGDCCESVCSDSTYDCGTHGYNCIDPSASDYGCDGLTSPYYGDGICDIWTTDLSYHFNTDICNWDGGDCCPSTCTVPGDECSNLAYTCSDPDATDFGAVGPCVVDNPSWIMDAYCDAGYEGYNVEVCGWDGGDCCQSTCLEEPRFYDCGIAAYACLDPSAAETQGDVPADCDITFISWLADGYCDENSDNYNTLSCGWDGGDCCQSTCVSSEIHACGSTEYYCKNPDATDYGTLECGVPDETWLNDGYCDAEAIDGGDYNTKACDWDGGDCCENTCEPSTFQCNNGFRCLDPTASTYLACPANTTAYYSDGFCDMYNYDLDLHLNSNICNWDGGDCCPSTCTAIDGGACASVVYECLDPDATDYLAESTCTVAAPSWIGDAYCDSGSGDYNTAMCSWDGGDCCEDTCLNEAVNYQCGDVEYVCLDPSSAFATGDGTTTTAMSWADVYPNCPAADVIHVADGYCDAGITDAQYMANYADCGWDGGDCCEETCTTSTYACGAVGYSCLDPAFASAEDCSTNSNYGNGECNVAYYDLDLHLNTASCDWDGGDCCESTCQKPDGSECDHYVYECSNPNVPDYGAVSDCAVPNPSWIADGYCDDDGFSSTYNNADCGYDGGDCCPDTCTADPDMYDCTSGSWACSDPSSANFQETGEFQTATVPSSGTGGDSADAASDNSVETTGDGGDDGMLTIIIVVVVVVVVIVVVIVVVVVVLKGKKKDTRAQAYSTHRPTTQLHGAVSVKDVSTY